MNDLKEVLDHDELHMFYLLLKDVEITVQVNRTTGEPFKTNIGSPQGDSASAFLFIFYLANSLNQTKKRVSLHYKTMLTPANTKKSK